ncbi:hypothetical protein V866_006252 [Kwoniella sp. B9012]
MPPPRPQSQLEEIEKNLYHSNGAITLRAEEVKKASEIMGSRGFTKMNNAQSNVPHQEQYNNTRPFSVRMKMLPPNWKYELLSLALSGPVSAEVGIEHLDSWQDGQFDLREIVQLSYMGCWFGIMGDKSVTDSIHDHR